MLLAHLTLVLLCIMASVGTPAPARTNLDELNLTWGEEPEELKETHPELSCFRAFPVWWKDYTLPNNTKQPQRLSLDENDALQSQHIYYLHHLLSVDECKQYIKASEQFGYSESTKITKQGQIIQQQSQTPIIWPPAHTIRSNKRLIWQIEQTEAERIYQRIKQSLPKQLHTFHDTVNNMHWNMVGLNARFRFFKYDKGDTFKPHIDAASGALKNGTYQRSFMSVVIYLNDDFQGGETQFFEKQQVLKVRPKQGSVLIFHHDGAGINLSKRHCAMPPQKGTKYIIRSDLMFEEDKKINAEKQ